jgi:hypothetical protein
MSNVPNAQTERTCGTCTAMKKDNTPCTLRTCKVGPYCWIHTWTKLWLKVRPSTIPEAGLGLFAFKPGAKEGDVVFGPDIKPPQVPKGKIVEYTGTRRTAKQLDRAYRLIRGGNRERGTDYTYRNPFPTYVYKATGDLYIDPIRSNAGVGRYANDCNEPSAGFLGGPKRHECNASFSSNTQTRRAWIVANEDITQGEEIFVDYSTGYWKHKINQESGSTDEEGREEDDDESSSEEYNRRAVTTRGGRRSQPPRRYH